MLSTVKFLGRLLADMFVGFQEMPILDDEPADGIIKMIFLIMIIILIGWLLSKIFPSA